MRSIPLPTAFHLRALPACLLSLVTGILYIATGIVWLIVTAFCLATVVAVVAIVRAPRRKALGVACLVCLALSLVTVAWTQHLDNAQVPVDEDLVVMGRVAVVQTDGTGAVQSLTLDHLYWQGTQYDGRIQLSVYGDWVHTPDATKDSTGQLVQVGDWMQVEGHVRTIAVDLYNSSVLHDLLRGNYYTMQATAVRKGDMQAYTTAVERVQAGIYRVLRRNMRPQTAGFAYAFLTGNTALVPTTVLRGFRRLGIAHLLAVSGLHVGVLAGVVLWLLKKCRCPAWGKPVVLAAVLGVYAWVCNASPSVLRASILAVTIALAASMGRNRDAPSIMSLAALALLAVQPLYLFDVSFLLSFAAFGGIVLLYKPIVGLLGRLRCPPKVANLLGINLAVTLHTFPMSAYFFGGAALLAIPLNLLFIPVMSILYVVLVVGLLVGVVPPLGFVLVGMDYALEGMFYVGGLFVGIGYVHTNTALWLLPLFYAGSTLLSDYCLLPKHIRYAIGLSVYALTFILSFTLP